MTTSGKQVAERVADFDWSRLQGAIGERLTDGPYHRMDMEPVGTVSTLGYKVNLAEWETKRDAANTQLERGVGDKEVVGRTIMAWQMPANQPSQATFLQWIKELIKQDCEGSEGDRTYTRELTHNRSQVGSLSTGSLPLESPCLQHRAEHRSRTLALLQPSRRTRRSCCPPIGAVK